MDSLWAFSMCGCACRDSRDRGKQRMTEPFFFLKPIYAQVCLSLCLCVCANLCEYTVSPQLQDHTGISVVHDYHLACFIEMF